MELAFSNRVVFRNSLGQFRRACEEAAEETIEETVSRGARLSRAYAPEGHQDDPRTLPLKAAIDSEVLSRTSGHWYCFARHALPVEFGAGPHGIVGNPWLYFYWESAGRQWIPGASGRPDMVMHPGNYAQPYLRPAYEDMMSIVLAIARQHYPN